LDLNLVDDDSIVDGSLAPLGGPGAATAISPVRSIEVVSQPELDVFFDGQSVLNGSGLSRSDKSIRTTPR